MRTTIDTAGRIVVPKAMRDELGFTGGAEVEISLVRLPAAAQQLLLARLPEWGVYGGATYDALIAATAAAEGATLVTVDLRASSTYARVGVDVEFVG